MTPIDRRWTEWIQLARLRPSKPQSNATRSVPLISTINQVPVPMLILSHLHNNLQLNPLTQPHLNSHIYHYLRTPSHPRTSTTTYTIFTILDILDILGIFSTFSTLNIININKHLVLHILNRTPLPSISRFYLITHYPVLSSSTFHPMHHKLIKTRITQYIKLAVKNIGVGLLLFVFSFSVWLVSLIYPISCLKNCTDYISMFLFILILVCIHSYFNILLLIFIFLFLFFHHICIITFIIRMSEFYFYFKFNLLLISERMYRRNSKESI